MQTTLGRYRAAHDLALAATYEREVDLIIIGKPNKKLASSSRYQSDNKLNVAVLPCNKNCGIRSHKRGEGNVTIGMRNGQLVCCFSSPNIILDEIKNYIDTVITEVLRRTGEKIIAGNLNAKSSLWGSPISEEHRNYRR